MVEICLKTVECAQVHFYHRFWPDFFQFGRNSTQDWFFCVDLGEIRPVWKNFGQFWRWFHQNQWRKFNCAHSTVFKQILFILAENKITVFYPHAENDDDPVESNKMARGDVLAKLSERK
jgi:hypothetical protein